MTPENIERHRAAKELFLALETATAKEVRASYAELFGREPPKTYKAELVAAIKAETLARLRRHVLGWTRVKVVRYARG